MQPGEDLPGEPIPDERFFFTAPPPYGKRDIATSNCGEEGLKSLAKCVAYISLPVASAWRIFGQYQRAIACYLRAPDQLFCLTVRVNVELKPAGRLPGLCNLFEAALRLGADDHEGVGLLHCSCGGAFAIGVSQTIPGSWGNQDRHADGSA